MNIQTWTFPGEGGTIPGIPGEWHIGQEVDVDMDTNTVLAVRTRGIPDNTIADEGSSGKQQPVSKKKVATLPEKQGEANQEGSA